MATFLHRVGRFAFGRRWLVLLLWAVALGVVGAAAGSSSGTADSEVSVPGTESQKAFDLLSEKFPAANADGASARVVLRAPDGEKITAASAREDVAGVLGDLKDSSSRVAFVSDPFTDRTVSANGTTAYAQVTYQAKATDLTDADHDRFEAALEDGRGTGLTVEASGSALAPAETSHAAEVIGFALAAVILVVTFGSLAAAGIPLVTAVLGVAITLAAITALTAAFDLNGNTSALATMLGIAVGIDYALFIVSRYRSERAAGHGAREAAARANGTAGSAVVFAGITVVIALAGLAVVDMPILTSMGLAAAGAVIIAVLVAITVVPALLGFAPERVLGRAGRRTASCAAGADNAQHGGTATGKAPLGRRWVEAVLRKPLKAAVISVAALGVVALPATQLELGLPDDGSQATSSTQRKAYDMLAESFGAGFNGPLTIAVTDDEAATAKDGAEQMQSSLGALADVAAVAPAAFNPAGDTAIINVIPKSAPTSSATKTLVTDIRQLADRVEQKTGAQSLVTGQTASNIDVSDKFDAALAPYLLLVLGLAFLVLILVFRSILVPLKAALGFILSVLASFGALVAVFQWGWLKDLFGLEQTGPIMSLMPILTVGIVFGLAMDYQVFLVTRMREAYVHGADPRTAIVEGFQHSARVVTVAALIMISVFAGFIGAHDAMIKALGFGLAIAVAFDAFVVRMTLVPAVLALLGKRAWTLPRWIDRFLPHVDIEGEKLGQTAPTLPPQAAAPTSPTQYSDHR
ncbi:MMPL family transporter [Streptomyces minutiscleroticus]|uniref:MMPL family transporter n=1 Tax=Streptomyces minutiscleroticus TaxID=68238 RepID=UPI003325DE00